MSWYQYKNVDFSIQISKHSLCEDFPKVYDLESVTLNQVWTIPKCSSWSKLSSVINWSTSFKIYVQHQVTMDMNFPWLHLISQPNKPIFVYLCIYFCWLVESLLCSCFCLPPHPTPSSPTFGKVVGICEWYFLILWMQVESWGHSEVVRTLKPYML